MGPALGGRLLASRGREKALCPATLIAGSPPWPPCHRGGSGSGGGGGQLGQSERCRFAAASLSSTAAGAGCWPTGIGWSFRFLAVLPPPACRPALHPPCSAPTPRAAGRDTLLAVWGHLCLHLPPGRDGAARCVLPLPLAGPKDLNFPRRVEKPPHLPALKVASSTESQGTGGTRSGEKVEAHQAPPAC